MLCSRFMSDYRSDYFDQMQTKQTNTYLRSLNLYPIEIQEFLENWDCKQMGHIHFLNADVCGCLRTHKRIFPSFFAKAADTCVLAVTFAYRGEGKSQKDIREEVVDEVTEESAKHHYVTKQFESYPYKSSHFSMIFVFNKTK